MLSIGKSQLITQAATALSQRAGSGLWALARPSFLEANQGKSGRWDKAAQASSTPRLPLLLALRRVVPICTQQALEQLGMLLAVLPLQHSHHFQVDAPLLVHKSFHIKLHGLGLGHASQDSLAPSTFKTIHHNFIEQR